MTTLKRKILIVSAAMAITTASAAMGSSAWAEDMNPAAISSNGRDYRISLIEAARTDGHVIHRAPDAEKEIPSQRKDFRAPEDRQTNREQVKDEKDTFRKDGALEKNNRQEKEFRHRDRDDRMDRDHWDKERHERRFKKGDRKDERHMDRDDRMDRDHWDKERHERHFKKGDRKDKRHMDRDDRMDRDHWDKERHERHFKKGDRKDEHRMDRDDRMDRDHWDKEKMEKHHRKYAHKDGRYYKKDHRHYERKHDRSHHDDRPSMMQDQEF